MTHRSLFALMCAVTLTFIGTPASSGTAAGKWADVEINATMCPQDPDDVPTIQASQFNVKGAPIQSELTALRSARTASNVEQITFSLPAGTYAIKASSPHCRSAQQMATLLAGATRHLGLALSTNPRETLSPSCAIAGALPVKGIGVELLSKAGTRMPIVVDGYVYDAERLGRGVYTLRLTLDAGVRADYVFDLSKEPSGEFCERTYIRNISLDDLRRDAHNT
jgi:hypothetical protein